MKNPLNKRFIRELRSDFGKYIAIFLFFVITIGYISGFFIADGSLTKAYDDSFEKYNIENGHFSLKNEMSDNLKSEIENNDVKVYNLYYADIETENQHTFRVFKMRDKVNKTCMIKGNYPKKDNEIAIDRCYAENNKIKIGDNLKIYGKKFRVSGLVALPDYSTMFKNNNDTMFDAKTFTIALVNDKIFSEINQQDKINCYAWKYPKDYTEKEKHNLNKDLSKNIYIDAMKDGNEVTDFLPDYQNQAIKFTGDDFGSDLGMIKVLLVVLIAVFAFIFAITTDNTINKEAKAIGTLRASGFTRGEMVRHYLAMPLIVTLISAVVGNIIGYTVFYKFTSYLYLKSYSFTKCTIQFNPEALLVTTLIPLLIIFIVNIAVVAKKLRLAPLQFLRREMTNRKKKHVMQLKRGKFLSRFTKRVIFQNIGLYITMFVGVFLSFILLIFGTTLKPSLTEFSHDSVKSMICKEQYVLKNPQETSDKDAEKYSFTTLEKSKLDSINIFGIDKDSKYLTKLDLSKNGVYVSSCYKEKYNIETGDTITLKDKYTSKKYKFKVLGDYYYPAQLSVFMNRQDFNNKFEKDTDYYTGYFSDKPLNDIDDKNVVTVIRKADFTAVADQLDTSMGATMGLVCAFSYIFFILIVYLLSKVVIEKNVGNISLVKILGYNNKEVAKLYIVPTLIVVLICIVAGIPLANMCMKYLYAYFMMDMSGWFSYKTIIGVLVRAGVISFICYLLTFALQYLRAKKIPMVEALKNEE